jgi:DNA-binding CsgD family transcriptional regulator
MLITLTEKGLVLKVQSRDGESRFGLLESIHEYLLEQLRASGEWDDIRRRHAHFYLELAEQSYSQITRADRNPWLDLLEIEHNNLRAALQWSLDTSEYALGKRIAAALWNPFWWFYGHMREGMYWLETFLQRSGDCQGECRNETHMRVLAGAGTLRGYQKDFDRGKRYLLDALQIAEERGDHAAAASILGRLGWIFWQNGKTNESAWLAERLEKLPTDASPWDLAYAFMGLGNLQYEAGLDAAEMALSKSVDYFNLADEKSGVFIARGGLALIKYDKGFHQRAIEDMIESLHAVGELKDLHVIAQCIEAAGQILAQELTEQKRAEKPDLEKLAHVLGWLDYSREVLSLLRNPRQRSVYLKLSEHLQDRLGSQHFLRAWNDGKTASSRETVKEVNDVLQNLGQPQRISKRVPDRDEIEIPLSPREHQVLSLVAEGLSGQQIAERLFITERTVRFHITSIYNKLGAKNRAQAVAIANRLELI